MGSLLHKFKSGRVPRVAAFYAIAAWILVQVVDVVLPTFNAPQWVSQSIILVLVLGFPITVILAWVFDLTSQGSAKTEDSDQEKPVTFGKVDYFVGALLLGVIGIIAVQQLGNFYRENAEDSTTNLEELAESAALVEALVNSAADSMAFADDKSIAILLLANLSPDPDNAYFAAGIHEEILNQLAKVRDIRVISRTAMLRYQDTTLSPAEIARELNVAMVMEGSVRFAADQVRVTLQLIRASDNSHLWSETYQFELKDIFAIQSEVALQVADAMEATLLQHEIASIGSHATENTEAYTLFMRYRYQTEQENARPNLDQGAWIEAGIRRMERAVVVDPLFARGFAELGYLNFFKGQIGSFEEAEHSYDEALRYANKAIAIDPQIVLAYTVLSRVSFERGRWDEWKSYAEKLSELPALDGSTAAVLR